MTKTAALPIDMTVDKLHLIEGGGTAEKQFGVPHDGMDGRTEIDHRFPYVRVSTKQWEAMGCPDRIVVSLQTNPLAHDADALIGATTNDPKPPTRWEKFRWPIYWGIWDFERRVRNFIGRRAMKLACWGFSMSGNRWRVAIDGDEIALSWLSVELGLANSAEWNYLTCELLRQRDDGLFHALDVVRDSKGNRIPVPEGGHVHAAIPAEISKAVHPETEDDGQFGEPIRVIEQNTLKALWNLVPAAVALIKALESDDCLHDAAAMAQLRQRRDSLASRLDYLDACDGGRAYGHCLTPDACTSPNACASCTARRVAGVPTNFELSATVQPDTVQDLFEKAGVVDAARRVLYAGDVLAAQIRTGNEPGFADRELSYARDQLRAALACLDAIDNACDGGRAQASAPPEVKSY